MSIKYVSLWLVLKQEDPNVWLKTRSSQSKTINAESSWHQVPRAFCEGSECSFPQAWQGQGGCYDRLFIGQPWALRFKAQCSGSRCLKTTSFSWFRNVLPFSWGSSSYLPNIRIRLFQEVFLDTYILHA